MFPIDSSILKGSYAVSSWLTQGGTFNFNVVPVFNAIEMYRPRQAMYVIREWCSSLTDNVVRCLLHCAAHRDATTLKTPKGGLINVALRDPTTLSENPTTGYLRSKDNPWIMSTLTGGTSFFSNTGIRQICITLFAHGWHRFVTVLSEVFNQPLFFVQSYKGGVAFSTSRFEGDTTPKKRARKGVAPIDGPAIKGNETSK